MRVIAKHLHEQGGVAFYVYEDAAAGARLSAAPDGRWDLVPTLGELRVTLKLTEHELAQLVLREAADLPRERDA